MEDPAKPDSKLTIKWLKTAGTFINNHKYWCSLAAIFSAVICLLLYTASQGIPFPISFVGSPELILIIMVVAYFVPFLFSFLLFMPFILTAIASYMFKYDLFEEIYKSKSNAFPKSNFSRFFMTVGLPMMVFPSLVYIQAVFLDKSLNSLVYIVLIAIFIGLSGLFASRFISQKDEKEQKKEIWSTTIIYNITLIMWELSMLTITLTLSSRYLNWPDWSFHLRYAGGVLILLFISFIMTFPSLSDGGISKIDRVAAILSIFPTALFLIVPINVYCFGKALKTFKLGGGYEVCYYVDTKDKKYFPDDIFEPKAVADKGLLKTKKIKVILRTKSESYIKIDTPNNDERIFKIDHKKVLYPEYFNTKRKPPPTTSSDKGLAWALPADYIICNIGCCHL